MAGRVSYADLTPLPLLQMISGFWAAKTLAAAVELDLFTLVDKTGGVTRQSLARDLGLEDRPADLLLAACASLGLLDKTGDTYVNTPVSETFLIAGSPWYFGGFIAFLSHRKPTNL